MGYTGCDPNFENQIEASMENQHEIGITLDYVMVSGDLDFQKSGVPRSGL